LVDFSQIQTCQVRKGSPPGTRLAKRCLFFGVGFLSIIVVVAACGLGWLYWRLGTGPLEVGWLASRIEVELNARLSQGYSLKLGSAELVNGSKGTELTIAGLELREPDGQVAIAAPRATVSVDPLRLAIGQVSPRRLDVFDLDLRLAVLQDGTVALSAGNQQFVLAQRENPGTASDAATAPAEDRKAVIQKQIAMAVARILALAAGASPLGDLEHVGIIRGNFAFDDQTRGVSNNFKDLSLVFERLDDAANIVVSADGANHRWEAKARASGIAGRSAEGVANLDVELNNFTLDEATLIAGLRQLPFDFDMPFSAKAHFVVGSDGGLRTADGEYSFGSGFFVFKDPDHEPLPVETVTGGITWQAERNVFDLTATQFVSAGTKLAFTGSLAPPSQDDDRWRLDVNVAPGKFGPERPNERDIVIERGGFSMAIRTADHEWAVEHFDLGGPDVDLTMTANGTWGDSRRINLKADVKNMSARTVLRLWPTFSAHEARTYLLKNLRGGRLSTGSVKIDFSAETIAALQAHQPIPDQAVAVDFNIADGVLDYLPGAPPLSRIAGTGKISAKSTLFTATQGQIDLGQGRRLDLQTGRFEIADQARKPVPATVNLQFSGGLDAVSDFMGREALKPFGGFPMDALTVKGQVDGRAVIDMRIGSETKAADTSARITAQVSNLSIEKFIGKERLDQASLTVNADNKGLTATGQGRLFGAPAKIDIKKVANGGSEAAVSFVLDDAARAKQGWPAGVMTGPVSARIVAPLGQGDKMRGQVELDLTRTAINIPLPGVGKPAGRAAKAQFTLATDTDKLQLQGFSFDGGTLSAQGQIDLDGSGGFIGAKLSQVRLSPGDDMRADIQATEDGLKIVARGNVLDARPMLLRAGAGGDAPAKSTDGTFDLDVKSALVTGHNGQSLANLDLRFAKRGSQLREFKLSARSGRAALTGEMGREGGQQRIIVRAADGGTFLSFLDYYKRMEGGQLILMAEGTGDNYAGVLSVRRFVLRNEPALGRLLQEGVPQRADERAAQINPNAVEFDRLAVNFRKANGRLDISDGLINGPSIGMTIDGNIDYARDRVALNGTFVPAFGLNNLFARVPLFGPLLGGSNNEGLFGVNFKVQGQASAPMLTVNPLSAIAPGFIRKIFGAMDGAQSDQNGQPLAPPQPPPPAARQRQPSMPMSISPGR
jgi:hypothetical protein